MRYIQLFENYDSFFDKKKYKGTIIYRGMDKAEYEKVLIGEDMGYFFSEDKNFAGDYGNYVISAVLNTNNVFNSLDNRNILKIYNEGLKLYDEYSDTTFNTPDEYFNSDLNQMGSDTWDIIESSHGVLDWIMGIYDACYITEGGVANYYINDPFTYLKILKKV